MKISLFHALGCLLLSSFIWACNANDANWDYQRTLDLKLPEQPYQNAFHEEDIELSLRDFNSVSRLELDKAQLSLEMDINKVKRANPDLLLEQDSFDKSFNLSFFKSAQISIIDPLDQSQLFWLALPRYKLNDNDGKFHQYPVGQIEDYVKDNTLRLKLRLVLDPYQVMRFKRDLCKMQENCKIPLDIVLRLSGHE